MHITLITLFYSFINKSLDHLKKLLWNDEDVDDNDSDETDDDDFFDDEASEKTKKEKFGPEYAKLQSLYKYLRKYTTLNIYAFNGCKYTCLHTPYIYPYIYIYISTYIYPYIYMYIYVYIRYNISIIWIFNFYF